MSYTDVDEFLANLEPMFANSAPYMFEFRRRIHNDATVEAAHTSAVAAHHAAVFGADAKRDAKGNFIQMGVGSKGRETGNHLASILKYEGPVAHQKELRRIWRETPDHARKMGFPEPERMGT
jgi:hypothetical protein